MVKELRDKSGAGMMDCKKVLRRLQLLHPPDGHRRDHIDVGQLHLVCICTDNGSIVCAS
jgi:hypothetical protein